MDDKIYVPVLIDKCEICGGIILIATYKENPSKKTIVDYGRCSECDRMTILPQETLVSMIENKCVVMMKV